MIGKYLSTRGNGYLLPMHGDFSGFQLSSEVYKVDLMITGAISKYPTPASQTDLRSFCGLVNQLASGTSAIAELMSPLRPLLNTKNEFIWSEYQDEAFSRIKEQLITHQCCFMQCSQHFSSHSFWYHQPVSTYNKVIVNCKMMAYLPILLT